MHFNIYIDFGLFAITLYQRISSPRTQRERIQCVVCLKLEASFVSDMPVRFYTTFSLTEELHRAVAVAA